MLSLLGLEYEARLLGSGANPQYTKGHLLWRSSINKIVEGLDYIVVVVAEFDLAIGAGFELAVLAKGERKYSFTTWYWFCSAASSACS